MTKELKAIARFQKGWVATRKEASDSKSSGGLDEASGSAATPHSPSASVGAQVVKGPFVITRREDVIEGLDKIISWLERNEPSSPLPMLLKRAKRLSTMSFLDILRDISPDGVTQAVMIGGPEPEPVELKAPVPPPKASSGAKAPKPIDPNDGY